MRKWDRKRGPVGGCEGEWVEGKLSMEAGRNHEYWEGGVKHIPFSPHATTPPPLRFRIAWKEANNGVGSFRWCPTSAWVWLAALSCIHSRKLNGKGAADKGADDFFKNNPLCVYLRLKFTEFSGF